jgi:hypothetical protein
MDSTATADYDRISMKTVSIQLPDALANWLEKQAAAERRSESRIVGEMLRVKKQRAARRPARFVSCHDLMKDLCGKYDGLPPDLSTNPKYFDGFGQ